MTELLQNAWYMAAWSEEVGERPAERRGADIFLAIAYKVACYQINEMQRATR